VDERKRLAEVWPLFDLAVRTPRLELRYPTDLDLVEVARRTGDIHAPDVMPFTVPWSRAPDGERERNALQYFWQSRAAVSATSWDLSLVVVVEGDVVGNQSLRTTEFSVRRTVETGSWLYRPLQGQGLGREMREAVLHLAFAGLGAQRAETEAYEGNEASRRVTTGLGYRLNGEFVDHLDGRTRRLQAYVLDRDGWEPRRRDDIELIGVEACRDLLGA